MDNYNSQYFGKLINIKENYLNKEIFESILKFDLFEKFPLSSCYQGDEYFGLELDPVDIKLEFNDFFLYEKNEYHLKKEIWIDMFKFQSKLIELYHSMSDFSLDNYMVNYHSFVTKNEKIDYLKKLNTDYLKHIKHKDLLFLFIKNEPARGYKSWEEFYVNEMIENENFDILFRFLKGEMEFDRSDTYIMWREFRIYKDIIDFIEEKLNNLEQFNKKIPKTNTYTDWRSDIFKNKESRELFNYITDNYMDLKNTSFFSMLYKYFQLKKYIILLDNDSKVYKDFVLKNFELENFSRIQKQTSFKINNKWDKMFIFFDELEKKHTNFTQ